MKQIKLKLLILLKKKLNKNTHKIKRKANSKYSYKIFFNTRNYFIVNKHFSLIHSNNLLRYYTLIHKRIIN